MLLFIVNPVDFRINRGAASTGVATENLLDLADRS
jgi:hypothetical protein